VKRPLDHRIRLFTLTNDLHEGGDGHRVLYFAKTLDRNRFWHRVVTLKKPNADMSNHAGDLAPQFAEAGIDVLSLDEGYPNANVRSNLIRFANSTGVLTRSVMKLVNQIRTQNIDVIDAHSGAACLVGCLAGTLTGTPRAITDYGTTLHPMMFWPLLGRFVFSNADVVISDSEAKAAEMSEWILRRPRQVHVIPNGITPPTSSRTRAEMLEILDLPREPETRVIGQVSGLNPHKGHIVLVEAAKIILAEEPRTAFLIVGYAKSDNSSYVKRLRQRAVDLGIADRVRICSYPGWIGDVWKAIDIQAHPALSDSLPNAIIEGMSLSKPAVVTAVGGVPTMVDNGESGLVIQPGDAPALAQALLLILRDSSLSKRLGEAARRRFERNYTAEITTRQLEGIFANLAFRRSA
jgi:glycosyltransferase involved in cell wall biosynthesis